jgi:hypothetical protein
MKKKLAAYFKIILFTKQHGITQQKIHFNIPLREDPKQSHRSHDA